MCIISVAVLVVIPFMNRHRRSEIPAILAWTIPVYFGVDNCSLQRIHVLPRRGVAKSVGGEQYVQTKK